MGCFDDEQLQMLVEGALERSDEDRVRTHLAECPRCRAVVASYKQLMWDLRFAREGDVELPEAMDEMRAHLMAAWKEHQEAVKERAKRSPRSLIPSWASYSVEWTRHMPLVGRVLSGIGDTLLPIRRREKRRGGGRR